MRYALINHGAVVNVILASQEFIDTLQDYQHALQLAEDSPVGVGWGWDGENLVPPPEPPPPDPDQEILQTIGRMEREQQLPLAVRTFMLVAMEKEAADLGLTKEQLMVKNKLYRMVKQFDSQIAALREQLS